MRIFKNEVQDKQIVTPPLVDSNDKKLIMMRFLTFIAFLIISLTGKAQSTGNVLTVEFDGIKQAKGTKVYVALYNSEDSFLKNPLKGVIVAVKNGKARAIIKDLKPGTYAVSSFYDKNDNGKMDTNFLGIPKEPTGLSNNAKARFGPPKYKDAKFEITADKTIKINY